MSRVGKLKMWIGNLDGRRQGLVIATSKKRAREIIGRCSAAEFDGYWALQREVFPYLATEVLYTRPIRHAPGTPWQQGKCPL